MHGLESVKCEAVTFGRIKESRCDAASVRFVAPSADVDPNLWSPIIADPLRARSALLSAEPKRSNPSPTFWSRDGVRESHPPSQRSCG